MKLKMVLIALAVSTAAAHAQNPAPGKGPAIIDISNVRRDPYKIAVPTLVGDAATGKLVADVVSGDLSVSGWFKVLDPKSFLANLAAEGTGIVVGDWRNVGAEGVSKGKATASMTGLPVCGCSVRRALCARPQR